MYCGFAPHACRRWGALPHLLQQLVGLCQAFQQLLVRGHSHDPALLGQALHQPPEQRVHCLELAALAGQLLLDVVAAKDGLQVQPALLAAQPRVEDVLRAVEPRFPRAHTLLTGPDVGAGAHRLRLDNLVVQQLQRIVWLVG